MTNGIQVTGVDFAVPAHYDIGQRYPSWQEAVTAARATITRFDGTGQYSRAFVHLRVTEPVQDRGDGAGPSGQDWVAASWEVFHDGTVRVLPEDKPQPADPPADVAVTAVMDVLAPQADVDPDLAAMIGHGTLRVPQILFPFAGTTVVPTDAQVRALAERIVTAIRTTARS